MTTVFLIASSNDLCLSGRHTLNRLEDWQVDVLRGKTKGCAAPDVRTLTDKDSHEGVSKDSLAGYSSMLVSWRTPRHVVAV